MNARLVAILAALAVTSANANVVDRSVHRALARNNRVNLIVTMKDTAKVTESFQESAYATRPARINALKDQLQRANAKALEPLAELFVKESAVGAEMKTYWISPTAYVPDATIELVEKIASLPGVASVREEYRLAIPKPQVETASGVSLQAVQGYEWGVGKIGAPQVWADGNAGQGVLVGAIDTGVRGTHEALKRSFAGAYGWFDPEKNEANPYDGNGHGTHVMGTIAGTKGVGVAPAATWMACKGCRTEDCPESDLLACAQFVLCPTDPNGENADCSKAPRVVSNSWGGGQADLWYKPAVDAWRKAGIIPVFAMGNEGPECGTASSPGDYPNVIGVGSTTIVDSLSGFSSKGPTFATPELRSRMKPEISAPGSRVRSSWIGSDSDYLAISGTSMATPHVSGSIALLLSQEPELTYEQVLVRLISTTDQAGLSATNYTCGGTVDTNWPNNQFGHGRLNVFNAYNGFRPAPTAAPTTLPPVTPAPTTPASTTPAPTTAAPTPAPTKRYEADCNRLWKAFCWMNRNCEWSKERNICAAK